MHGPPYPCWALPLLRTSPQVCCHFTKVSTRIEESQSQGSQSQEALLSDMSSRGSESWSVLQRLNSTP